MTDLLNIDAVALVSAGDTAHSLFDGADKARFMEQVSDHIDTCRQFGTVVVRTGTSSEPIREATAVKMMHPLQTAPIHGLDQEQVVGASVVLLPPVASHDFHLTIIDGGQGQLAG